MKITLPFPTHLYNLLKTTNAKFLFLLILEAPIALILVTTMPSFSKYTALLIAPFYTFFSIPILGPILYILTHLLLANLTFKIISKLNKHKKIKITLSFVVAKIIFLSAFYFVIFLNIIEINNSNWPFS